MCGHVAKIRELYWSDLCGENLEAYRSYLVAAGNGLRAIVASDLDGSAEFVGSQCRCADDDVCVEPTVARCRVVGNRQVVGIVTDIDSVVGSEDNVDGGVSQSRLDFCDSGISIGCAGCVKCGVVGGGTDAGLCSSCRPACNSTVDGGSVGLSLGTRNRVPGQIPRGPNFERNQLNREAKKRRKQERAAAFSSGARQVGEKQASGSRRKDETQGFWNSCSPEVRQQLIDSKARMHVAENERKAKEAQMKCNEMDSPYAIMQKVVKMAEFAEKQAVRANDDRIYGWAKTVASSSAESLAKSTPSSVPSFAELEEKLAASSQSSFDLSLKAKDDEIDEWKRRSLQHEKKVNDLEMTIAELKLAKGIMDNSTDHFPVSKMRAGLTGGLSQDSVVREKRRFVPTAKQPWPHVKLTPADVYREF